MLSIFQNGKRKCMNGLWKRHVVKIEKLRRVNGSCWVPSMNDSTINSLYQIDFSILYRAWMGLSLKPTTTAKSLHYASNPTPSIIIIKPKAIANLVKFTKNSTIFFLYKILGVFILKNYCKKCKSYILRLAFIIYKMCVV